MIKKGARCKIGEVKIKGEGDIVLGDDVIIEDNVTINVSETLEIQDRSHIGQFFEIEGRHIKIGREFWSGRFCGIGGGSCFEKLSSLTIGEQCHIGDFSFINTARAVLLADEVGLGQQTKIYTHGTYQSFLMGFPVEFGHVFIGERVWCPGAIILPNVTIGHDTVVGVGSIVTKSLPSGCLALGVPAKVVKENCYPAVISMERKEAMLKEFINHFRSDIQPVKALIQDRLRVHVVDTLFDLEEMKISGPATQLTEKFKDELRRYGVRFRYCKKGDVYAKW